MHIKAKVVSSVVAGCAVLAFSAAPAAAAQVEGPATVTTAAGTTCTVDADVTLGAGLLVKPVNFSGSIDCAPADPSNVGISSGGIRLDSSAPLGLGTTGGNPKDPQAQETVPAEEGFAYTCDLEPGVDCGFSGSQPLGLPGTSYTVTFGTLITPPKGETFTTASEGCTLGDLGTVSCASEQTVTVR